MGMELLVSSLFSFLTLLSFFFFSIALHVKKRALYTLSVYGIAEPHPQPLDAVVGVRGCVGRDSISEPHPHLGFVFKTTSLRFPEWP